MEILVVLVIMGLLISIVAPNVIDRLGDARQGKAKADIHTIQTALKLYYMDNSRYPTTEQGLEALIEQSSLDPTPTNFRNGGYLEQLSPDPWNKPYIYFGPEPEDPGRYEIYSLGRDGLSGGEGEDADIGNLNEEQQ